MLPSTTGRQIYILRAVRANHTIQEAEPRLMRRQHTDKQCDPNYTQIARANAAASMRILA